VTYGAGGTTRERTHNTVARMVRETDLNPAAHLTHLGALRREELERDPDRTTALAAAAEGGGDHR
jgi:5,10-methylenetetrahydrofolate reductase